MKLFRFCVLAFSGTAAFSQSTNLTTSPGSVTAGGQPFSLTVNVSGQNSASVTATPAWAVRWNGSLRPTHIGSGGFTTTLTADISAADIAQPGFAEITVIDQATGVVFPVVAWAMITVDVDANDFAYDSARNRFYVSVPTGAPRPGAPAESIVAIDAASGGILQSLTVGSKPTLLAISDDDTYLYAYLSGSPSITRILLDPFVSDLQIPLGSGTTISWMAVVPGSAASLATVQTTSTSSTSQIVVYDNAVRRPTNATENSSQFVFAGPQTLIAGGAYDTPMTIWNLSPSEVSYSSVVPGNIQDAPIAYSDGWVLGASGKMYDLKGLLPVKQADYAGFGTFLPGQSRLLLLGVNSLYESFVLGAFDEQTMTPLGRLSFEGSSAEFTGLSETRVQIWGTDGVAFLDEGQLFFGHTELAAAAPATAGTATVNAATLQSGAIAPGEILSIFGTNLGLAGGRGLEFSAPRQVSSDLGGTQVWFDGLPGTMLYTSTGQINVVAPFGLADKTSTKVQVWYRGIPSTAFEMPVAQTAPGIFTQNGSGSGPAAILNADYSLNTPAQPAAAGSAVSVFATGGGVTSPPSTDGQQDVYAWPLDANVQVTLNGTSVPVLYAGAAPGLVAGVVQINFQIPAGTPSSSSVPLQVSIGGQLSASGVTMSIR